MKTIKMSAEGQILISKEMLAGAGFAPGAEFTVHVANHEVTLTPVDVSSSAAFTPTSKEQLRGFLQGKAGSPIKNDSAIEKRIKARLEAEDDATKR